LRSLLSRVAVTRIATINDASAESTGTGWVDRCRKSIPCNDGYTEDTADTAEDESNDTTRGES
jgi:hypothetical protein